MRKVFERVILIKSEDGWKGSAFTIEKNDVQYIVTAKHLFEDLNFPNEAKIGIYMNNHYEDYEVFIKYPEEGDIDIAVIKLKDYKEITPKFDNNYALEHLKLGEDVWFLGFPFDYEHRLLNRTDSEFPTPFLKKAYVSGISKNGILIYLDGMNNEGFSGGPSFIKKDDEWFIIGVICSYRYYESKVYDSKTKVPLEMFVKENTGIINSVNINEVYKVIKQF